MTAKELENKLNEEYPELNYRVRTLDHNKDGLKYAVTCQDVFFSVCYSSEEEVLEHAPMDF